MDEIKALIEDESKLYVAAQDDLKNLPNFDLAMVIFLFTLKAVQ